LRLKENLRLDVEDEQFFKRMVSAGFSQKRKTLLNNLANATEIGAASRFDRNQIENLIIDAGVDPKRRAETLTLEEWAAIVRRFVSS
jgi:16S rRNA (adenine1518-N6/adenine1519-N6)-dimethyltransferase